jgi:hypothetical protein
MEVRWNGAWRITPVRALRVIYIERGEGGEYDEGEEEIFDRVFFIPKVLNGNDVGNLVFIDVNLDR